MGELMDGRRGLVPSNFVERVPGWIFTAILHVNRICRIMYTTYTTF